MFTTLELVAYALIALSMPFKGIALMNLNNKTRDFAISKKKYMIWGMKLYKLKMEG